MERNIFSSVFLLYLEKPWIRGQEWKLDYDVIHQVAYEYPDSGKNKVVLPCAAVRGNVRTEYAYDYVNQMAAYDLLVIDDFGLMELNVDKCRDLFEVIETRDCKNPP